MDSLTQELKSALSARGAALVGVADLTGLPPAARKGLPRGVSLAVTFDPGVIARNIAGPTPEYYAAYLKNMDEILPAIGRFTAVWLGERGYRTEYFDPYGAAELDLPSLTTPLSQKMIATRAGLGWIGKNGLLVTPEYGSAVNLAAVLTDAPLTPDKPVDVSRCGTCRACLAACPAGGIKGENWSLGTAREALLDLPVCHRDAKGRTIRYLGVDDTICGICITVCPWTKRAGERLQNEGK